jgi:hypothetical protein
MLFEGSARFITWANAPDDRGERYAVVWRTPCPGIGWARIASDGKIIHESGGAFYDGVDDHPEGAIEWARSNAAKHRAWVTRIVADLETPRAP